MHTLIRRGLIALQKGDCVQACRCFRYVVAVHHQHITAWLCMVEALETERQKRSCLEHALMWNPARIELLQALTTLADEDEVGGEGHMLLQERAIGEEHAC